MSNEERDEEMSEETRDESVEETDDYSYDTGRSGSGGGSSAGIWVIIILVVIALIGLAWYQWDRSVAAKRAEEAAQREQTRQTQIRGVAQGVPDAEAALQRGDIDAMIDSLEQMDQKLQIIATAANQSGDTEAAQRVGAQRRVVQGALDELRPLYEQIQAQRRELEERAGQRLQAIRTEFGVPGGGEPVEPVVEGDAAEQPTDMAPAPDGGTPDGETPDAEATPPAEETAPPVEGEVAPETEAPAGEAAPEGPAPTI